MIEILKGYDLSIILWVLVVLCGVFIGMAKTGFSAAGMPVVPVLALIFGGKPSTGLLLPMLIFADIYAVTYYHRHAEWKYIFKLLPWALAGVLIAVIAGIYLPEHWFKRVIAIVIIGSIGIMLYRDYKKSMKIPDYMWFSAFFGTLGGFSSMIGNAAGVIMAVYMLSINLPKNNFIATQAWFFFMLNLVKLPLHIFVWETVTIQTVSLNIAMIPAILLGAFLGVKIVKIMSEKFFRWMVIFSTVISSLLLFK